MSDQAQSEQALKSQIESAFADAEYPGDEGLVPSENAQMSEELAIIDAFKGKHWKSVPEETLLYHKDILPLLTPAAYRYYLPAFMLVSILKYEEADLIPEYIVYDLSPSEDVRDSEFFRQRIEVLSGAQRRAVSSFLEWMKVCHPDALNDSIDRALVNLGF